LASSIASFSCACIPVSAAGPELSGRISMRQPWSCCFAMSLQRLSIGRCPVMLKHEPMFTRLTQRRSGPSDPLNSASIAMLVAACSLAVAKMVERSGDDHAFVICVCLYLSKLSTGKSLHYVRPEPRTCIGFQKPVAQNPRSGGIACGCSESF